MCKIYLLTCLFSVLCSFGAIAQTRLTNPKIHVLSHENIVTPATNTAAIPYMTTTSRVFIASPWTVWTPDEFQALSKEAQQEAILEPTKFFVTTENKELLIQKIQSNQPVTNLLLQQPLKK